MWKQDVSDIVEKSTKSYMARWSCEEVKKNQSTKKKALAFGAKRAIRAAAAFPALFSSMKLMVELIISKIMMPTKS
jgi:hypothetical protein